MLLNLKSPCHQTRKATPLFAASCACHGGGANAIDAVIGVKGTSKFHLLIKSLLMLMNLHGLHFLILHFGLFYRFSFLVIFVFAVSSAVTPRAGVERVIL